MIQLIGDCYFISDKEPSLEWIQKTLEGYMEVVYLSGNRQMLVNDNGAINGMDLNPLATNLNIQGGNGDPIFGPAIILSEEALLT